MELQKRESSDILKKGYSDEEISHIYELGRLCLENGHLRQAETIFLGLTEVAPDFSPSWLARSYLFMLEADFDQAIFCSRQAHRINSSSAVAIIYLAASLMAVGDFHAAGTYLGEVGEQVEAGEADDPKVVRLYKALLLRFQNR